ncbi:MAG: transketolase [Bacteroidales bacterium]|jgi:transketolase
MIQKLTLQAELIRKRTLEIIYGAKAGHTGGSLSAIEVLTALYFKVLKLDPFRPDWPERDRFVMSKGHSVEALYCVLSARGFFPDAVLDTFGQFNSPLFGHPTRKVPGVELNSGALGHGLSVAVGMALAARMDKSSYRCYALMGDGEQGEGSVYEAAMAAGHYRLDKLTAIIDRNHLQISGKTEDVMTLEPMDERWKAFGWEVFETEGNDIAALLDCFERSEKVKGKPKLIISHSIKGKGVSYMENIAKWHHGVPNSEQFELAMKEIDSRIEKITH